LILFAVVGVLTMFFASPAPAQSEELRSWRADTLGWKFTAIFGEDHLVGFLATAKVGTTTGDNIHAILYERRLDGSWSSRGWIEGDADSAYGYARSLFGLPDSWADGQGVGAEQYAPEEMFFGLPDGDPLLELVATDPNPGELVGLIADAGLPAAPALSTIQANDLTGQASNGSDAGSVAELAETDLLNSLGHNAEEFAFGSSSIGIGGDWPFCSGCSTLTIDAPGPWTLLSSWDAGSARHCTYSRTFTRTCAKTGLTIFLCNPCPLGNSTCTGTQYGDTTITTEESCPTTTNAVGAPGPIPCLGC
jgi:hypothetical protein